MVKLGYQQGNQEQWSSSDNVSAYNESFLRTYRLGDILQKINYYKSKGKLIKWQNELDNAFDELFSDAMIMMKDTDFNKYANEKMRRANKKIIEAKKEKNQAKLVYWLRYKERIIRHIQNLCGRGSKILKKEDKGKAVLLN